MENYDKDVFKLFFVQELWEKLVDVSDRNLSFGTTEFTEHQTRRTTPSIKELKQFYLIQMEIENTWGNGHRNLNEHFAFLQTKHNNNLPFGSDRFHALRNSLIPNISELQEIARICSKSSRDKLVAETVREIFFIF